jgi:hypothetical protein
MAIGSGGNLRSIGCPYQRYLTSQPTNPTTGLFDFRICKKKINLCRLAIIHVKFIDKCSIVINERIVELFVPALFLKYTIPFLAMGFQS